MISNHNFIADVTLRYSTNCCSRMLEDDGKAILILADLLDGCNRSLPHIEVMSIIFDILISLAEFEDTRPALASGYPNLYEVVIRAMAKGEKNLDMFGKGCSLLWRLASESSGKKVNKHKVFVHESNDYDSYSNFRC